MSTIGILLVAHGTISNLEDLPAFLSNIRAGRLPSRNLVQAVRSRYEAIGGLSPLLTITQAQASLLEKRSGLPCFIAMRMWHPTFEEVLRDISQAGVIQHLIVLCAAPHSTASYVETIKKTAENLEKQGIPMPTLHPTPSWAAHPSYIEAWVQATKREIERLGVRKVARSVLVPTAHSLPMRVIETGAPYPHLVMETANAVIHGLGDAALPAMVAFQSQGMTNEPWLGPDLPTVFARAASTGAEGVLVVPVGFPSEHVETLYDLDIEAKQIAKENSLFFARVPCLDTDERLISALWDVVQPSLDQLAKS